jgi:hypothetical protein
MTSETLQYVVREGKAYSVLMTVTAKGERTQV